MSKEKRLTRQEFTNGLFRLSIVVPVLKTADKWSSPLLSPERETVPIVPGGVFRDETGQRYLIKQELDHEENLMLCRYRIDDFESWKYRVGYKGKDTYISSSHLDNIPIFPVPSQDTMPHWDGTEKTHNKEGGVKFVLIPGLGSVMGGNDFDKIRDMIKESYGEGNILDPSYKINSQSPLLGTFYDSNDSSRNPYNSLATMDRLLHLYKKQFPLEKFWLIGHSQGGWLAYELARIHTDAIAGVITLNGAIKGGGYPDILSIESAGANILFGEAAEFFVKRRNNPSVSDLVEQEVKKLRQIGIIFVSFASTDDFVVRPEQAFIEASDKIFYGQQLDLVFPMGITSINISTIDNLIQTQTECRQVACLSIDLNESPVDSESAQLAELQKKLFPHWAVLAHPKALESMTLVITSTTPPASIKGTGPDASFFREYEEDQRKNTPDLFLSNKTPYQTDNFLITSSINRSTGMFSFTISPKGNNISLSKDDAISWLRSTGLTDRQIQSLTISFS